MKTFFFLIFTAIIVSVCCFPSTAQDYSQIGLPEGAIARHGKGRLGKLQFSPKGHQLAVSTSVGIWFYDPDTGKMLDLLPQTTYNSNFEFAYSPAGHIIASASKDGKVHLLDVATKQNRGRLTKYGREITALAFSPDGTTLVAGDMDGGTRVWNTETLTRSGTLRAQAGGVTAVAYSPDGKTIATGGSWRYDKDHTVQVWDAFTGKRKVKLIGHKKRVTAIAYSPDSSTIATASSDKTVRLWDGDIGKHKTTLTEHTASVNAVIYLPNGSAIATASSDKTVRLWDGDTGKHKTTLIGHTAGVNAIACSADSTMIASASSDGTVRLWDVDTGETKTILTGHNRPNIAAFSPDGDISISEAPPLRGVDAANRKSISPDGKTIATVEWSDIVQLFDAQTGKRKATLRHTNFMDWIHMIITDREYDIGTVAFSPDGNMIVTGGGYYTHDQGTVDVWHTRTRKRRVIYKGPGYVSAVAFSPDGKTIAAGDWENRIRLWHAVTGKELQTIRTAHKSGVNAIGYAPDGKTIATGSWDTTLRLWNAKTGKQIKTFTGHIGIKSILYAPNGDTIVTGHEDGTVLLWDLTPILMKK